MIVPMVKLRILGPRARLPAVIETLQDTGLLHFAPPADESAVRRAPLSPAETRRQRQLGCVLQDVDAALEGIGCTVQKGMPTDSSVRNLAVQACLAHRVRREAQGLTERLARLEEERALIERYRPFFAAFRALEAARGNMPDLIAYHVVLRREQADALPALRKALGQVLGDAFQLYSQALASGELAALLLVPRSASERIDHLLAETRVQEIPVPHGYGSTLADAIPRMLARSEQLPGDLAGARSSLEQLARAHGAALAGTRAAIHDLLARYDTLAQSGVTEHAFVIEGWAPEAAEPRLRQALAAGLGADIVVEHLGREQWRAEDAPVVLSNPRLFRPFEMLTRMVPLPRYGTIDPTPFVAVFFPMFFGLILGDVGYGLVLVAVALAAAPRVAARHHPARRRRGSRAPAPLFTIVVRHRLRRVLRRSRPPLVRAASRCSSTGSEAIIPFLVLARGDRRRAHGARAGARRISSARDGRSPAGHRARAVGADGPARAGRPARRARTCSRARFLTPAVVVAAGGLPDHRDPRGHRGADRAPLHLGQHPVATPVSWRSAPRPSCWPSSPTRWWARIGQRGRGRRCSRCCSTSSISRLGLFTPTIHALRLHYVEFFGTFYSPGGVRYHPLGHWTPEVGYDRLTTGVRPWKSSGSR